MELSNVISILALASTIVIAVVGWNINRDKDDKESNNILITLNTEMKYNTKQLENIDKKLESIESKLDDTALKVAKHESDIKTLFDYIKLHLFRIRRIENHVGIKGEDDENRD